MQKLKQSFLTIVIGLALAAGLSYAWTGPTANPPENNAPAPINVSSSSQIKTGALQVNGFRNIGNSMFDGLAQFKSGNAKETSNSTWFPASDGKNYIRGKTIFADGAIGSGGQNLNDRLNNRVGIGTTDPKAKLEIKTNDPLEKEWALRIKDGAGVVPDDYVLTSFTENGVDGLAGWAPAPVPPPPVDVGNKNCHTYERIGCTNGTWDANCSGGYVARIKSDVYGDNCGGTSVNSRISVTCCDF